MCVPIESDDEGLCARLCHLVTVGDQDACHLAAQGRGNLVRTDQRKILPLTPQLQGLVPEIEPETSHIQ